MGTTQDGMMAALGPGQLNDLLLAYYKANGATSSNITDAEYEFLIVQGASPRNVQDMWEEYLESEGWSGSVDDMKNSYWVKLGGGTVLGPDITGDLTGFPEVPGIAITKDAITLDGTASDYASVLYSTPISLGSMYEVKFTYYGTGLVRVRAGDASAEYVGQGTYTQIQTAGVTDIRVQVFDNLPVGVLSPLSVREIL